MKKNMLLFSVLAVFAVLFLLAAPAVAEDRLTDHIIQVSGYGESITTPDKVTITLGIETTGTDPAKVQKENTETMNKVIAALKNAGIKNENIKTSRYSMYSYVVSEYNKQDKYEVGDTVYSVSNTVQVISYDVDATGSLIDTAVDAGANTVNNVQFGLSNEKQKEQRNLAIISAVKAARADADSVAAALDIRIGGTGTISVSQSYTPVSYGNVNLETAAMDGSAPSPMVSRAAGTQIEAGSLSTTATVSIVFTY